jgi:hypothetical protein
MIDALDAQAAPITAELRAYAKRQIGCRALMKHYGFGPLTAVTILAARRRAPVLILAPRGPLRRPGRHRLPVRPAPRARPPLADRRRCAGRCTRRCRPPDGPAAPTTTSRPASGSAATAPAWRWRWRASCSSAATTRSARSATTPCSRPDTSPRCAPSPPSHRCTAVGSPHFAAATSTSTPLKD